MRKVLLALGLLAATGLTGCDWWAKPAPQPVVVTCQCAPPIRGTVAPAPAVAPGETRAPARHHAAHPYRYSEHYAESSVDTYNYSSPSRGSYESGAYGGGEGGYGAEAHGASGDRARAWEDGYGRRHLYDAGETEYYAGQSHDRVAQTPRRLDPWHGYDDDWD